MRRLPLMVGLVLFGLALLVGSSESQDKKAGGKIRGMLPTGFKALNLSKAQIEKIYAVQIEHRTKIAELNKQIEDLKATEKKEVFKVLTDQQREQYLKSVGVDTKEKKNKS